MPAVTIDQVTLTFGTHPVFDMLSMQFDSGRWHSVLGRSGVGKTSLLRMIAGLQQANTGVVQLHIRDGSNQRIAYVPQDDSLLPWLSIVENVQLAPRLRGATNSATKLRALELLEQVGLKQWAHALPATLSGGMRQRVALARALLEDPSVILMDEPFSRLDAITRHELQTLSFTLMQEKTVIMVTHDPLEAFRLSHQIHVLQTGTPSRWQLLEPECNPLRELAHQDNANSLSQLWQLLNHDQIDGISAPLGDVSDTNRIHA